MSYEANTIGYYDRNVDAFSARSISANMESAHKEFVKRLPKQAVVLDFGCGCGRDTKYFMSLGYEVDAIDGSTGMCQMAHYNTGLQIKQMSFGQFTEVEKYNGIWACASILHLRLYDLQDVMHKLTVALKPNGIIYTSFKYGTFEGERNGRHYTDMTEDKFKNFLKNVQDIQIEEQWVSQDVRAERNNEKWLCLILRKERSDVL